MKTTQILTLALALCLALLLSACQTDISRNPDGSLTVETTLAEAALQAEIDAALNDRPIQSLTVNLEAGYLTVQGERQRADGLQFAPFSFRLDLRAEAGRLVATASDVRVGDRPLEAEQLAAWNERIGARLERLGNRRPNSSLQSVTVTEDSLQLIWRVETARGRQ